ncbi:MAG TPA: hypothetical protein VFS31_19415 [Chitinophagaceae bacterium]|nr:hypothetical protein [Chitinophagaceae bacterium]
MSPFKLNKGCIFYCLLLLLSYTNSGAQEAINNVILEKLSATSFRVKYKLNPVSGYEYQSVTLKIKRRRKGVVEEILSGDITPANTRLVANQTYSYIWKTDSEAIKNGDELQARILVSYSKPAVVKLAQPPPVINVPPRADAGGDITIQLPLNLVVILDGIRSYDEDGRIVSINWRQVSGPSALRIASPTSYKSYVVGAFKEGVYAFELSVTDDKGGRSTDTVTITAKAAAVVQNEPAVKKKDSIPATRIMAKPEMPKLKGGPNNALLNILLPGVGHYFVSGDHYGNDRKPQVLLISALYAGSIGGAVYYKLRSNSQYNKYIELSNYREYQKDDNGNIIGVRGANQAQAEQYLSDARHSHNNFLILTGVSAGIMAADVIYTFVKGSKNKKAWEAEARGSARLFISPGTTGLAFGVQIKL